MKRIQTQEAYRKATEEWLRSFPSNRIIEELDAISNILECDGIYNSILLDDLNHIEEVLRDECVKRFRDSFTGV